MPQGNRVTTMKKKAPSAAAGKKKSSKQFGVRDFLDLIDDWGHPTWSTFAVEAPAETLTEAYAKVERSKKTWPDAPVRKAGKEDDEIANLVPVVQLKDSPWSVIYRVIGMPFEDFER
jgi:hypothetical protein